MEGDMRTFIGALALAVVCAGTPAVAQQVPVEEVVLDNGLTLLLLPRPGDPNVAAGWVAKVGSVHERPGITGVAHLFEHMMFKGTAAIGTRNIEQDLQLSLIHISEPTRRTPISYAVFCLKKKTKK